MSPSSGDQSSGVFEEKEHGYFTYFLLKAIQEAKGKLSYGELFDDVRREVMLQAGRDEREQEPSFRASPQSSEEWRNWEFEASCNEGHDAMDVGHVGPLDGGTIRCRSLKT